MQGAIEISLRLSGARDTNAPVGRFTATKREPDRGQHWVVESEIGFDRAARQFTLSVPRSTDPIPPVVFRELWRAIEHAWHQGGTVTVVSASGEKLRPDEIMPALRRTCAGKRRRGGRR